MKPSDSREQITCRWFVLNVRLVVLVEAISVLLVVFSPVEFSRFSRPEFLAVALLLGAAVSSALTALRLLSRRSPGFLALWVLVSQALILCAYLLTLCIFTVMPGPEELFTQLSWATAFALFGVVLVGFRRAHYLALVPCR